MPLSNSLAAVSTWMTYLVQVAFVYLVAWGLSLLVRNARVRLRVWGCFLFLATSYWIYLAIPHGRATAANVLSATTTSRPTELVPGWSWAIPQSIAARLFHFSTWVLPVYMAIVLILLLQSAAKSWSLRRFLAGGFDAPSDVNAVFEQLCREMHVRKCRLIFMPGLRSPATANWWRPYVLLPAELALELEDNQLADVLRHELIHIRRRDYLWDRLAAIACRLVFFHPVLWLAHRRLRWEREFACDEAVVRHNNQHRVEYAECLTTLARWWFLADRNSRGAIGFASSASLLGTRVQALLIEPVSNSIYQRGARAAVIVAVLAITTISLPGMHLSFYWSQRQHPGTAGLKTQDTQAARKVMPAARRTIASGEAQSQPSARTASAGEASTVAPIYPTNMAVIENPSIPVFTGVEQQHSAPDGVSGASGDGVVAASASGGSAGGVGPAAPQPAAKKPSWGDTAVDAITTGVAIIRSRTAAPSGTSGGTPGTSGGGTAGGGTSGGGGGGGGGGEGPDHFTGPN